jgi:galactokinase
VVTRSGCSIEKTASAYAPGRIELLGNHTDYHQGLVLGAAIDRGLTVSGSARSDKAISIASQWNGRRTDIPLSELEPQLEERWANYALGVASELIRAGVRVKGFSAEVSGDLPAGSGLSSSAAFEVATALFLLKLHDLNMPPLEVAKICQRAENRFVGVQSGLLDQVTSIFGRANHAVYLDCRTEEVRPIRFPRELALVIAEPGRQRELAKAGYNERRAQTFEAAHALGVKSLRDVTSDELERRRDLAPLLKRRALHVVQENARVQKGIEVLEANDGAGFGALMNASHDSSRTNFENSTAELDLLVNLARQRPGVLGARLTGAGFGGATVTLCQEGRAAEVAADLATGYSDETGEIARTFICRIAPGAS